MRKAGPRIAFLLSFLLMLFIWPAAVAASEDYFDVPEPTAQDSLIMRMGPSATYPKLGAMPPDATGIANLGCIGEPETAGLQNWCLVGFDRQVGWMQRQFLAEGQEKDGFRAGQKLSILRGSEWRATRAGDAMGDSEWVVRFGSEGRLGGSGGCNQLIGSYTQDGEKVTIGPIATTRRLCEQAMMDAETAFIDLLSNSALVSAHHLVMVLLSDEGAILAQFARTDWD